jgi:hypothetical protein
MKKLSLFKNTEKKTENAPDYRLVASYQDASGAWVNETVGSFWKPKTTNPKSPALTGNLSEAREYQGKQYTGYKIVPDGVVMPKAEPASPSALPDYPPAEEDIDPEDIPF